MWIWVKHSVFSHFPKDRNCEICQRTKITRPPCRRRNGGAVPRAENFGDMITADHKVLSENSESRNNHRYAVVVEDLATQWTQSYPGKIPYERRFGQPFKGPIIPFGSLVEYHPITAKDQSRIHQFGKKVLPGLFLGYALYAGGIWKGDVLVADLEELETMDASEIYSKRLNAKEVIFHKKMENLFFQPQMDESNFLEEIKI